MELTENVGSIKDLSINFYSKMSLENCYIKAQISLFRYWELLGFVKTSALQLLQKHLIYL